MLFPDWLFVGSMKYQVSQLTSLCRLCLGQSGVVLVAIIRVLSLGAKIQTSFPAIRFYFALELIVGTFHK